METQKTDVINELNKLIVINNDRTEGYERASSETKDSDLKTLFNKFASQSRKFHTELVSELSRAGGQPEKGTTTSGKFYRAWMDFKSAVSNKDRKAILSSCEFGEDVARDTYKDILKEPGLPSSSQNIITSQFNEITRSHDEIKQLRDSL